jgi:hypothetical protein
MKFSGTCKPPVQESGASIKHDELPTFEHLGYCPWCCKTWSGTPLSTGARRRRKFISRLCLRRRNGSSRFEITESASISDMPKLSLDCLRDLKDVGIPARASGWRFVSALSRAGVAESGPSRSLKLVPSSVSQSRCPRTLLSLRIQLTLDRDRG